MLTSRDILLDEFVRRIDPVPWYEPRPSKWVSLEDLHGLVLSLVEQGLLARAGVVKKIWEDGERHNDVLYGPTPEGLAFWEANVKGKRRETRATAALPKYSQAKLAVAMGPRDVFDLARVPWRHKLMRDLE